jgi:nucleotide-binding universal stress UspA family protein
MHLDCSRILLATEHTDFDVGAERAAFALARRPGVTVSAVVPLVTNVEYETIAPALVAHDEEQAFARSVAVRAAASAAGVAVETRVRRADAPWRAILAEAEERAVDLIVVRRRGHRGFLANLMVGEMVDKVATLAPCHVLIVPRAAALPAHRVLAGIDQSRAGPEVARVAARMAVAAGLPLTLMSVALEDSAGARAAAEKTLDAAAHIAREAGASVDTRAEHGRAADAIAATAAATGSDLVVAGRGGPETHGRRLRLGGNAHRIVGLVPCAVLVVKP